MLSKIGLRTVDVGNAMLSMHSIRETAGSHDVQHAIDVSFPSVLRGKLQQSELLFKSSSLSFLKDSQPLTARFLFISNSSASLENISIIVIELGYRYLSPAFTSGKNEGTKSRAHEIPIYGYGRRHGRHLSLTTRHVSNSAGVNL